ncbi:MAG TPA: hypothetical protein VN738_12140, partial [Acidothermaceae bacterium]|nr:hypothetical protein [Acidothermaceae bacterium]
RADARAGERTAERAAQEQAMQQLRGELEKVRADAAAEVAEAREQVAGAEARAEQRSAERAAERAAHEDALQRMRVDVEQARAYAEAEVAAALGWAAGDSAAARKAADTEIARARATAEDAIRRAQATAAAQFLSIPVAPLGVRVRMRQIENLLIAMHQIDYVLEVGMAEEVSSHMPLDIDLVRSAVQTVHETAFDFTAASRVDAAARYTEAAGAAFRAFLERIDTVVQQVRPRAGTPAAVIVDAVVAMLADPRVVAVRGAASSL